jgi:hypothetical protein
MTKIILFTSIALVVGAIAGFFLGRFTLERQWSQPYTTVTSAEEQMNAGDNPSPKAGASVLKPMPIGKSRAALATLVEHDAVRSPVAAIGAGDEGVELHVVVENRGACTLTSLSGVAYGFDAYGKPSPLRKSGRNYVAFESKEPIPPGKKHTVAAGLTNVADATLAIAQIDKTTCSDGTSWARR